MNSSTEDSFCPYVGLAPYTEADHDYFFGRERDVRIVSSNLYAAPLTVLYGASGVGKSSVLQAGVVPQLRNADRTVVVVFRDWQRPDFLTVLKSECIKAFTQDQQGLPAFDATLPLDELLFTGSESSGCSILILLDQFEEYFLYHPESQADNSFDAEFARTVNREEVDANFLIAMREDGLSKLDRFRTRIPNLLRNTLRLQHLDYDAADHAVRRPLELYNSRFFPRGGGMTIEDELVRAILTEVQTGQVFLSASMGTGQADVREQKAQIETPFLQLVLTKLWKEETRVNSSVIRLSTFEQLGRAQEIVCMHLYSAMDTLVEGEQEACSRFFDRLVTPSGVKIAYTLEDLAKYAGDAAGYVSSAIGKLSDVRLLRAVAPALDQPTKTRYEIFHDVLAPAILEWRARFVQKQEQADHVRKQEAELTKARALAEEQEKTSKRFQRLSKTLTLALIAAFAATVVAAVVWWKQGRQYDQLSITRELDVASMRNLDKDAELGVLLALHSLSIMYTPEAEEALHRALHADRAVLTLSGHKGGVTGVAFSSDGIHLATCGLDSTIRIWDASTGGLSLSINNRRAGIWKIAYSPDGSHILTANLNSTAEVRDASSGTQAFSPLPHDEPVMAIAYSGDGQRIATADLGGTTKVWDARSGKRLLTLDDTGTVLYGVALNRTGSRLATASKRGVVTVWNTESMKRIWVLQGHSSEINDLAFSPDDSLIATASRDISARVWNPFLGIQLRSLLGHTNTVKAVTFSSDGSRLATASYDLTAKVWDPKSGSELFALSGHSEFLNGIAFSPDGGLVATASDDGLAKVWNAGLSQEVLTILDDKNPVDGIVYSPDGSRFFTAAANGMVKAYDALNGVERLSLWALGGSPSGIAISSNGKLVATSGYDGLIKMGDAASGDLIRTIINPSKQPFQSVAFSPDGRYLATASDDSTAKIWNRADGKIVLNLAGHTGGLLSIAFSPNGKQVATASADQTAKVWDASDGHELFTLYGHTNRVRCVSFSPNGSRLATASADSKVKIWDVASHKELLTLSGHHDGVRYLAFSPDGARIASASLDKTVKIWDVVTGRELFTLYDHTHWVQCLAFSPDGRYLTTGSLDGTVRVHAMRIEDLKKIALERLTRSLTIDDCGKYLHVNTIPSLAHAISEFVKGKESAKAGREDAIAHFQNAMNIDSRLQINPKVEFNRFVARASIMKGEQLAKQGETQKAIEEYAKARQLDSTIAGDFKAPVRVLLLSGYLYARLGKIDLALAKFKEAQALDSSLITAAYWNDLCWWGTLYGRGREVFFAGEKAVKLDPNDGNCRDTRGVARAMRGDYDGAIKDFESYVAWSVDKQRKLERQRWISELRAGRNPFTAQEILRLRSE